MNSTIAPNVTSSPGNAQTSPTQILQIYPSADTLPENLLRFYLYFSQPMRKGQALRYIHLLNEQCKVVPDVFLDAEELWNAEAIQLQERL